MADPEQIYQEVLQEEQQKGSSGPVAEGRAKAARARAEQGSPHPKEPKWWAGAQPHFEGNGAAPAAAPTDTEEEAPAEAEPASEPEPASAEAEPAAETPEPVAAQATETPPVASAPPQAQAEGAQAAAAAEVPAQPQPAEAPVAPTGVTHGTATGTRLRPEDGVTTEAQFEGQRAMYERRKLIDELVSTGVPTVTAADTGRPRAPWLAILYLVIPLLVIAFLVSQDDAGSAGGEAPHAEETTEGGGGATTVVAESVAFDTEELTLEADKPNPLTLDNQDTVIHNLSIYEEEGGDTLFEGPDVDPGASAEYTIDPLPKGEYVFICDYHPTTMKGTVAVE